MSMTSRQRMETALSFQEPDRVPIEAGMPNHLRDNPKAEKLVYLIDNEADNFGLIEEIDWGLLGAPSDYSEEQIEKTDEMTCYRCVHKTQNGEFSAIREHDNFNPAYWHWRKNFFETLEDVERLVACDFLPMQYSEDYVERLDQHCGSRLTPKINMTHPFGQLVRVSNTSEFYIWLYTDGDLLRHLFEKQYAQIYELVNRLKAPYMYNFGAFEMAIPPWIGREMFDEFIYPYDREMNTCIHKHGGLVRHHCHDKMSSYLEYWADMGVDSIEPLEMPPLGDIDLKDAKKRVGDRMSLAGNIPSELFLTMEPEDVDRYVREAIEMAAKGGGFILRCSGGSGGLGSYKTEEQLEKLIAMNERWIEAGLKYGAY